MNTSGNYPLINTLSLIESSDGKTSPVTAIQFNGVALGERDVTSPIFTLAWNLYRKTGTVLRDPIVRVAGVSDNDNNFLRNECFRIKEVGGEQQVCSPDRPAQLSSIESGGFLSIVLKVRPRAEWFVTTPVICFRLFIQSSRSSVEVGASQRFPLCVGGSPHIIPRSYEVGVKIIAR